MSVFGETRLRGVAEGLTSVAISLREMISARGASGLHSRDEFCPPGNSFAPPPGRNSDNFAPPPRSNRMATNDLRGHGGAKLAEFRTTKKKKKL
jgi:hypothetical protein